MDGAIEDLFEGTVNLEESHLKEGYDEGYSDGIISGKEEGQQVGLKSGIEAGYDEGYVCISAMRVDPNFISPRVEKTIKQMDALRLKLRAIKEYNGYPKASDGNTEGLLGSHKGMGMQ